MAETSGNTEHKLALNVFSDLTTKILLLILKFIFIKIISALNASSPDE